MTAAQIDVVHIGSASRDLTADDPRGWRLGGGVTYAALTTARLGLRTAALVVVDAGASSADELDLLRGAGVELELVRLAEGPVFDNRETPTGREQICHAVGRPLAIPTLPASWIEATAWSLVPVAGEVDDDWVNAVPSDAVLALGWQGLLRHLVAGDRVERRPPTPSELVRRADVVGVSAHDLAPGIDIFALSRFLHPGARLLVTDGRSGGTAIRVGDDGPLGSVRYLSATVRREVDPTGAGDVFLAAVLATVVDLGIAGGGRDGFAGRGLDLEFAAIAGALVVEGPGLSAVPMREAVLARRARGGLEA
ncbi:MAG: hypothetical protein ABI553_08760 [Chloroflexota bacterium]